MTREPFALPPDRATGTVATIVIATLLAGVAAGLALAHLMAPASNVARFVGFMVLPLVLGGGYQLWKAQTLLIAVRSVSKTGWQQIGRALLGRSAFEAKALLPSKEQAEELLRRIFIKANSFGHAGVIVGLIAGIIFGAVADAGFIVGFCTLLVISAGYGFSLMILARRGYIPPPDES